MQSLIWLIQPLMSSPSKASTAITQLAIDPTLNETSGKYFINRTEAKSSKQSYDLSLSNDLWVASEKLINYY